MQEQWHIYIYSDYMVCNPQNSEFQTRLCSEAAPAAAFSASFGFPVQISRLEPEDSYQWCPVFTEIGETPPTWLDRWRIARRIGVETCDVLRVESLGDLVRDLHNGNSCGWRWVGWHVRFSWTVLGLSTRITLVNPHVFLGFGVQRHFRLQHFRVSVAQLEFKEVQDWFKSVPDSMSNSHWLNATSALPPLLLVPSFPRS